MPIEAAERGAEGRQRQDGRRDPHGVGERGVTTRAISRCLLSAAPARCTPPRWRANSAFPPCWCRRGRASPMRSAAWWPTCGMTSSRRSTSRCPLLDEARVERGARRVIAEEGAGVDRQGSGRGPNDPDDPLRRHAVRRPDPHPQRAAAFGGRCPARTRCRRCSKKPISSASASNCRKSAPTSSTSIPPSSACSPAIDLSRADRSSRARGDAGRGAARDAASLATMANGWRRRSIRAKDCRSTRSWTGRPLSRQMDDDEPVDRGNVRADVARARCRMGHPLIEGRDAVDGAALAP